MSRDITLHHGSNGAIPAERSDNAGSSWFQGFKTSSNKRWDGFKGRYTVNRAERQTDEFYFEQGADGVWTQAPYAPNFTIPEDMRAHWTARNRYEQKGILARVFAHVAKKDKWEDMAYMVAVTSAARWATIGFGTVVGLSGAPVALALGGGVMAAVARTAWTIHKDRKKHNLEYNTDIGFWEFARSDSKKYWRALATSTAFSTLGTTFGTFALPHLEQWASPALSKVASGMSAAWTSAKEWSADVAGPITHTSRAYLEQAKEAVPAGWNAAAAWTASALINVRDSIAPTLQSWDMATQSLGEKASRLGSKAWNALRGLFASTPNANVAEAPARAGSTAPETDAQTQIKEFFRGLDEKTRNLANDWLTAKPVETPIIKPAPENYTPAPGPQAAPQVTAPEPTPDPTARVDVTPPITVQEKLAAVVEETKLNKRWTAIAERAMDGNPQAQKDIAKAMLNGSNGFGRNPYMAASLYKEAAAAGNLQAKVDLAYMKFHGLGGIDADQKAALAELRAMGKNSFARTMIDHLSGESAAKKSVAAAMQRATESTVVSAPPIKEIIVDAPAAADASTSIPDGAKLKVLWTQTAEGQTIGIINKEDVQPWMKDGMKFQVPTANIR